MRNLILITILFTVTLYSTIYENGSSKKSNKWKIYNKSSLSVVKYIYDRDKKSRVVLLKGKDIKSGYMLPMERDSKRWCKSKGKSLKWSIKTKYDFVILVSLQTTNGHRYIIYTPSSDRLGAGYYGLGRDAIDGKWHKFKRDLDLDLKRYEPDNNIIAVDTFFIRGREIRVDDIEIESIKNIKKKKITIKKPKECNIYIPKVNDTVNENNILDEYDTIPPVIKLNGSSSVTIKLGGVYKEQGAIAIDNIDGKLNVDISGDIDTNRVGTYTLFYMTKDKTGNTSMTTRMVRVVGVAPNSKNREYKKREKIVHKNKIEKKDIDNLDLEKDMPPEDEALQEYGIVDD